MYVFVGILILGLFFLLAYFCFDTFKDGLKKVDIFFISFGVIIYFSTIFIIGDVREFLLSKNSKISKKRFLLHRLFMDMDKLDKYNSCAEMYIEKKKEKIEFTIFKHLHKNNEFKYINNHTFQNPIDANEIGEVLEKSEASKFSKKIVKGYIKECNNYSTSIFDDYYKGYLRGDYIKKVEFPIKDIVLSIFLCMLSALVMIYQQVNELDIDNELASIFQYIGLYVVICLCAIVQGFREYKEVEFKEEEDLDVIIDTMQKSLYENDYQS